MLSAVGAVRNKSCSNFGVEGVGGGNEKKGGG